MSLFFKVHSVDITADRTSVSLGLIYSLNILIPTNIDYIFIFLVGYLGIVWSTALVIL